MTNHLHLIVLTRFANLDAGMQFFLGEYGRYFNDRYGRSGSVFDGRYRSRPPETEEHYRNACEYVLQNPVAAGLCEDALDYRWTGGSIAAALRESRVTAGSTRRRRARALRRT